MMKKELVVLNTIKEETIAITSMKNLIACKQHKLGKTVVKIKYKTKAKESKFEDSAKRLLTILSCAKKLETPQRINKNCYDSYELAEFKKELEKVNKDLNDELIELNQKVEEQKLTEVEANKIKSYLGLAPTNLAALSIDGIPIHKFCCVCKSYDILHAMKLKYIYVDETLQESFISFF
jgi:hypothetical protein